jgi:hypothetical protein
MFGPVQVAFPWLVVLVLVSIVAQSSASFSNLKTPPVTVKGNGMWLLKREEVLLLMQIAFFANGKRFYIRGVDYMLGMPSSFVIVAMLTIFGYIGGGFDKSGYKDNLADVSRCKRDIAYFKKLNINTIRVYAVDNTANHDECMQLLADAGIYLALDVNTPNYSLNNEYPWRANQSYNAAYLQNAFATVDAFSKYDNTLLFFSANEIIFFSNTSYAAPYMKAVTRDLREYIKARGYRPIPVGYSAKDNNENLAQILDYVNCGPPEMRADFAAINDYSWCSGEQFEGSAWQKKTKLFASYNIPIL